MEWSGRKNVFLSMIKRGKYIELRRLVLRRLYITSIMHPVGILLGAIVIPLLYLLEPFKKIRIGVVPVSRIGHLSCEAEFYLRRIQAGEDPLAAIPDAWTFFVTAQAVQPGICNRQLLKMYKRNMRIADSYLVSWIYYSMEWLLIYTRFIFSLSHEEVADKLVKSTKSSLVLLPEEVEKGDRFLKSIGLDPDNDWFACVFARDDVYLNKMVSAVDWSYHDWQNVDIDTLIPSIEYIIEKGGFVFRMGHHVEKPVSFSHERFIDYAENYRDDFLDVFLLSKCKFFLTGSSGITDLATAMNKPVAFANCVPPGFVCHGNAVYIPKKIKSKKTGQYYPLEETLKNRMERLGRMEDFLGKDYTYEDNTPHEILALTKEVMEKCDGTFQLSEEDALLLKGYFDLFKPYNYSYGVENPIALHFLKNNLHAIFS